MSTNGDGSGNAPKNLTGVTFLGMPAISADDRYAVKHADGSVEGPMPSAEIAQRLREGDLGGTEMISRDGSFWIPMLSLPMFRDVLDEAPAPTNTVFGVGRLSLDDEEEEDLQRGPGRSHAAPTRPAPLSQSGLGSSAGSLGTESYRSGAWASLEDSGAVPAVQAARPTQKLGAETMPPSRSVAERLLPTGFAAPSLTEDSGAVMMPLAPRGAISEDLPILAEPEETPGLDRFGVSSFGANAGDAPTLRANRAMMDDLASATGGLRGGTRNLPRSSATEQNLPEPGMGDLPRSADSGLDDPFGWSRGLPQSAAGLPRSAGGNLPKSAAGLPQSATGYPQSAAGYPQSAAGLPQPASGLPQTSAGYPQSLGSGPSRPPGTAMMSAFSAGPELPASRAGQGNILENAALDSSVWSDEDVIPGVSATTDARQIGASGAAGASAFSFDDDPFDEGWDPTGSGLAGGASTISGSGSPRPAATSFFSEDELPPAPAGPSITSAMPARPATPARRSGMLIKVGAGVVVAAALASGAYVLLPSLLGSGYNYSAEGTGEMVVVAPVAPVATQTTLPSLTEIETAGPASLRLYLSSATVGETSAPADRARQAIAQALLVAYLPDELALARQVRATADALASVEGASAEPLVALAIGAANAIYGDVDGAAALSSINDPEFAGLARMFEALATIQNYRGVNYNTPAPAVAEAAAVEGSAAVLAEGSAAVVAEAPADGSAVEASGEGSAAAPAEGSVEAPPPEPVAVAPVVVVPVVVPIVRPELDENVTRPLQAATAAAPGNVSVQYWAAWVELNTGESAAAVTRLNRVIELNPEHVPANVLLAEALLKSGDLAGADARIQSVIDELETQSSAPERAMTYIAGARISVSRMQTHLAIESLLSALQADPRNREALNMLGEQFSAAGEHQRALEYFQSNAELSQDDPEAVLSLVRAQLGLGQLDAAQTALDGAVTRFPQDPRFVYSLARVAEERAEFEDARALLAQASQMDPGYHDPVLRLAVLAQRENDPLATQAFLAQISLSDLEDSEVASQIGQIYLSIGETNRAVGAFRRALELDQTHPGARINLAEYYLQIDQAERSLQEVELMRNSGVDTPALTFLRARALNGLARYSEALEDLTALVNSDLENADYLFALGTAHFGAQDWTNARRRFSEAYEVQPSMAESLYYIGRCDIELGAVNEAISSLTTVSHRSVRGEYHYWLGVALEAGGQALQAFEEYSSAINDDVGWTLENPEVFYRRAQIFQQRGANGSAFRDLRVLLTLRPMHEAAAWSLGRLHFDERRFDEAVRWMLHSLSVNPEQPNVRYYVALSLLESEPPNLTEALAYMERARNEGYGAVRPELFQRLGYLYRDLGRTNEAVGSLRTYMDTPTLTPDERRETQNEVTRLTNGL
jgi:tetratricopeptide (TPR) repeat protein